MYHEDLIPAVGFGCCLTGLLEAAAVGFGCCLTGLLEAAAVGFGCCLGGIMGTAFGDAGLAAAVLVDVV